MEMTKMIARIGTALLLLACAGCAAQPGHVSTNFSQRAITAEEVPTANGFIEVPGANVGAPGAAGSYAQLPPGTIDPNAQ